VAYNRGNGEEWKPLNYERKRYGLLPLREALAYSNNVITVKLLAQIGIPYFLDYARKLGLSLRTPNDLSLALGTEEISLIDLTLAYAPFSNGGVRVEPRTIIRLYDRNRDDWLEIPPIISPAINPATAYVLTGILKDVLVYGTARGLVSFSKERPVAGKTGTTDDYRDTWFIGYTPHLITGVWVGYDRPRPGGKGFTGGAISAPIWAQFMRPALRNLPAIEFPRPESVVTALIDPQTGYLANPECPNKREENYLEGTEPGFPCPLHGRPRIEPPPPEVEKPPEPSNNTFNNTPS
jgi:membrane carboxypeptidase/penicillin-binding protein